MPLRVTERERDGKRKKERGRKSERKGNIEIRKKMILCLIGFDCYSMELSKLLKTSCNKASLKALETIVNLFKGASNALTNQLSLSSLKSSFKLSNMPYIKFFDRLNYYN